MRVCDVTEDEKKLRDHLLAILNDELQPDATRFEAAKAALPLCYTPIPEKHIETTGEPMSSTEWLRQAQAKSLGQQVDGTQENEPPKGRMGPTT